MFSGDILALVSFTSRLGVPVHRCFMYSVFVNVIISVFPNSLAPVTLFPGFNYFLRIS